MIILLYKSVQTEKNDSKMSNPICKADFNGFANYKYVLDNNKNIF